MPAIHKKGKFGGQLCGQKSKKPKLTDDPKEVTCKKCIWIAGERDDRGQGITITSEATGEVQDDKPYRSDEHLGFGSELVRQQRYVRQILRNPDDPNAFAKLTPEQTMEVLDHLSGYYDRLTQWLANQKLWHSDLKTQFDLKFAQVYLKWKRKKGETNETARMEAKIETNTLLVGIDKCKHQLDVVTAWQKSIGRYHDAARSNLSWEKQSHYMQNRNDNVANRR